MLLELLLSDKGAQTTLETCLISLIASVGLEEMWFKKISSIGQEFEPKSRFFDQEVAFEASRGSIDRKTQYNGYTGSNKSKRDPIYRVLRSTVAWIAVEPLKTI